jgi:peptidyl-tRNA hydrolase
MGEPILYILMRNDLPSMNAGKAMAQASHAANAFIHSDLVTARKAKKAWQKQTDQGFGTVLVLSVNYDQLLGAIADARRSGLHSSLVDDPTYPRIINAEFARLIPTNEDTAPRVINGDKVTIYREETTCGYIFGTKEQTRDFLGSFPLHP